MTDDDNRAYLRLPDVELVPSTDDPAVVGSAWDLYLAEAIDLVPDVLTTLLTDEAVDAAGDEDVEAPTSRLTHHIQRWCQDWGLREEFAVQPAFATVIAAREARSTGTSEPQSLVSRWDGTTYGDGSTTSSVSGRQRVDSAVDWYFWAYFYPDPLNPENYLYGAPHPYPELDGRRIAILGSEEGWAMPVGKFSAQARVSLRAAELLLSLPPQFWDPTLETKVQARARISATFEQVLDRELTVITEAYKAHNFVPPPSFRNEDAFRRLVRFQILRESRHQISADEELDRRGVTRMIERAANLLGITLRDRAEERN